MLCLHIDPSPGFALPKDNYMNIVKYKKFHLLMPKDSETIYACAAKVCIEWCF